MRRSRFALLVAPLLAFGAMPAFAHGPGGGACHKDLEKLCSQLNPTPAPGPGNCVKALCPNAAPGPEGFATCLQGLAVSKECKTELSEMQAEMTAWQTAFTNACGGDVTTFCNHVTTGMRGQSQCLHHAINSNQAVTSQCQTFLAQHHEHGHHGPGPGECDGGH